MAREIVNHLDSELAILIRNLKELVNSVPQDLLYRNPPPVSIGENILRSAAVIEQTCGGLTANLWDDPFEWTLPETLSTADRIVEYLSEVDAARQHAFASIVDDSALTKYIAVPSGEPRLLVSLLVETLVTASDYRGRAVATSKILFGDGATRFII
ncbi:MAG TPA: hypothetical protein VFP64_09610 [Pyrinomonadaceae bacterium]|nr:hypothetical protein [Pyrinomonadaceae bacterium]